MTPTPQPGAELIRRLRETANGYYTGLTNDVDTGLLVAMSARWSEQLENVAALTRQRDDMVRRLTLAASVAAALRAMCNEPDEFDDHDGRLGHITYATLVQSRTILARWDDDQKETP